MKRLKILFLAIVALFVMLANNEISFATEGSIDNVINDELPELYIKAINPGYTIDGKSNVGEMIELARKDSDSRISLAGVAIRYTNSSGNTSILLDFPEHSYLAGESMLLRLASSPGSELANLTYAKTLAMKGGLALVKDDIVLDEVCWNGKDPCYKEFISSRPTSLVRDTSANTFEHLTEYEPKYVPESYEVEIKDDEQQADVAKSQCRGIQFSELLSFYETNKEEQFIELYNAGSEQVLLDGCQIKYKNKHYPLSGIIKPDEYFAYYPRDFNLTKNPISSNTVELIDTNGETISSLIYPNGQRRGTSYAWIGYNENGNAIWKVTYAPTPGAANNYQEFKTCEDGKVINETTGNCVKVTTVTEKACPAGQYLNPLTGRCRKVVTTTEKTCKEGYYLNPETGRCRKIVENTSANYSIKPEQFEEHSSFIALYSVIIVVLLAIGYLIYEFRHEIVKLWRRVWR